MSLRRVLFLLILLTQIFAFADGDEPCKAQSKKAVRLYNKAIQLLVTGQKDSRREAYKLLVEATKIERDYSDANFALGDINYQKSKVQIDRNKKERLQNRSLKYFEKVILVCPQIHDSEVNFYLGELYYKKNEKERSRTYLENYLRDNKNNYFKVGAEQMLNRLNVYFNLINNPVEFTPVKLEGISTAEDEFLPIISPDGEIAIYTHRYNYTDPQTQRERLVEELTVSQRSNSISTHNDLFGKGEKMPLPFNKEGYDQGAMSMTINNGELYITICEFVQGQNGPFKNCDIYVSYKRGGEWTGLKNLGPNINGKYSWESQPSISADGKRLFFASIRPTNIGFDYSDNQTSDIYYSTKDKNGNWSKAKNVGAPINTIGNEKSPFLHTDSKTLYFSSDYIPGVGGYDIFYIKEQKTGWAKPINIGYPINKETNDLGFFVSTNGKKAYFSSDELDDNDRWNIYSFNLYENARPEKVFFAKGKLLDENGEALTDAKIEIRTSKDHKVTTGVVDKETGDYAIAVAVEDNEDVLLTVKKKGCAFSSKYIKINDSEVSKPKEISLAITKVEVGKIIKINDIYFASNSSMFLKGSVFILDNFVEYLKENPTITIEIHGHTDNIGSPRANKKLSEKRAKIVRDFLVFQGIPEERIVAFKGFGASSPVASNKTAKGRGKNRRTEFLIVSQ